MWRGVVAAALVIGCRGDPPSRSAPEPPAIRSAVPALPQSPDGRQELVALDRQIEQARAANDDEALLAALGRRAMLRGRHEDLRYALQRSREWVEIDRQNPRAWAARVAILIQTHDFVEAKLRLEDWKALAAHPSEWEGAAATIAEATGKPELAREYRERTVAVHPSAVNLTNLAANLAARGQLAEAIAMIPDAAAALRDPSPILVAWLLVQWGRLHVERGELAAGRQLFEEAHRRLPGYVDATVQLATVMRATGGDPTELVIEALVDEPEHPELLALAGRTAEAHAAWTRYLAYPLTDAFVDHAARFYLGPGRDPDRARQLAMRGFVARRTPQLRALLVEALLATDGAAAACTQAPDLATGTRAQQFLAWRAFTACGQTAEAARLEQTLGIR